MAEKPYRKTGYLFVDTLDLVLKRRAVNVVEALSPHLRKEYGSDETEEDLRVWTDYKTDQQMDRYPDNHADVETVGTDRVVIGQMLSDPSLTEKERRLLRLLCELPDATYEELAEELGIRKQTVYEQLQRIRKKLKPYKEDAMYRHQKWAVKNEKPV